MLAGALRGARPAMLALAALGITALAITVGADAPDLDDTGLIGELYDERQRRPRHRVLPGDAGRGAAARLAAAGCWC